ncbi:hypothetical protein PFISCL1PPCAC_21740 [Pristionchus fissidentatus]|uniref:peptidylamidoglycolate lyase n=1 Tax=Pristionchus fissidentatus TaxID=1538716 RepID=A0AAV5WIG2_9BILA|nr:hypothetical protein PFISCL1PPCAC_21740 [Pristionchus fissidentatus]
MQAPTSFLLLLIVGVAAGQYLENQEYDVDENGLPMDNGPVETAEEEDAGAVDMQKRDQNEVSTFWKFMAALFDSASKPPEQQQPEAEDERERLIDFVTDTEEEDEEKKRKRSIGEEKEEEKAFLMSTSKPLGQISGMTMDKKGRLVVFHRADRVWDESTFDDANRLAASLGPIVNSTIAVINATTGQVLEEHGENLFYLPHGLSIDEEGNIWVTDVGSHQVHKLGPDFKPLLTLGEKLVPGEDTAHFCQPTDVAVAKNGIFFVADGYCNSRVIKFDRHGNVIAVFEAPDDQSGSSPFIIPHSLALIEDLNLLCVADRENERVQCYSSGLAEGHRSIPAGIPITSAENIGRVYAIREKNHYLVGVTGADVDGTLEPQLFTMDMDTGKANTFLKGIENAHALAISDDGKVYVGQMNPNQIVVVDLV